MPLSVEEADKQADKLLKEMYPEQFEDDDANKEDGEGDDDQGTGQDGDQGAESTGDTGDKDQSAEGQDEGDKGHTDEVDKDKQKSDDWEQKYRVLKGKYDKEVPALHQSVKQLQEDIQSLRSSLSDKKESKKATIEEDNTTDPDIAYLAEEFPDIHRAVEKMLASGKTDPNVDARLQTVESSVVQQAKEKFFKDLTAECNDWESIRDDERFAEWLNEVDELTDAPRYQLAVAAQNKLNGKQLAKFYNRFKKEHGIGEDNGGSGKSEKDLEKHTGMPKSKSGKTPDIKGKDTEIVTREDIKKFYQDAASGRYVGNDEAFKKMESKIHKAMQEGRIT